MDMEVGAHSMPSSQYTSAGLYGYGALAHGANSGAGIINYIYILINEISK